MGIFVSQLLHVTFKTTSFLIFDFLYTSNIFSLFSKINRLSSLTRICTQTSLNSSSVHPVKQGTSSSKNVSNTFEMKREGRGELEITFRLNKGKPQPPLPITIQSHI